MKYIIQGLLVCAIALLSALLFDMNAPQVANAQGTATSAKAIIQSTDGSGTVLGEATFMEMSDGMKVDVSLSGVPVGYHGFHVHEFNSCDDGGSAAGGHFNPRYVKHGYVVTEGYADAHVGDLGNIVIYSDGTGRMSLTVPGLPLLNDDRAIAGHSVILHADRDDFGQPTGNAGGRIGCGIIDLDG
ncbi:MAG: superoxide dismutase family protein [Leptolyngbyaceae bacterium]|nr:superoxide dismutase family protein [Leptolyngbyaceae bacterium]